MTAPLTTLRSKRRLSSRSAWGGKRNLQSGEGRYLLDDLLEHLLTRRGIENLSLTILALGSLAGVYILHRYV